jgi:hypothetical protein
VLGCLPRLGIAIIGTQIRDVREQTSAMESPMPQTLMRERPSPASAVFSVLLSVSALWLSVLFAKLYLHLAPVALAAFGLVPVVLANLAARVYGPKVKNKGVAPFIIRTAGRLTAVNAGLAILHATPRRVGDIALALIALYFTWWISVIVRRRRAAS